MVLPENALQLIALMQLHHGVNIIFLQQLLADLSARQNVSTVGSGQAGSSVNIPTKLEVDLINATNPLGNNPSELKQITRNPLLVKCSQ